MLKVIFLFLLAGMPLPAMAADFDCEKASTSTEKMICGNKDLFKLDQLLNETYTSTLKNTVAKKRQLLVTEQRQWLRKKRAACKTEKCLINIYQDRVDALDPLADKILTCEKMRKYPTRIFSNTHIDLGTGHWSPTQVDYSCPESIASLPFIKSLMAKAETIHEGNDPGISNICSGSIVHAIRRGYLLTFLKARFSPLTLLKHANDPVYAVLQSQTPIYFKQWSRISPYNERLYKSYIEEAQKAEIALKDYYHNTLALSKAEAEEITKYVMLRILVRAAGTFPSAKFKTDSALLKLVSEPNNRLKQLRAFFNTAENKQYSEKQVYLALKSALLQNRRTGFVSFLLKQLPKEGLAEHQTDSEPVLSFALNNRDIFQLLIKNKAPVNAENAFGKTALFYAIGSNNHQAVSWLLNNGADVNHRYKPATALRTKNGTFYQCIYPNLTHTLRAPLMHAAQNSDVEMLKLLIKNGANLGDADELGFNALDYAKMEKVVENQSYLESLGMASSHKVATY